MIRRMFVLGALALMVFAPAAHAQYSGSPGASVSDSTVSSGDTVTVSATGCTPGSTVTFSLDGSQIGSGTTDANGTASADVVITGSAGSHTITNSCNDAVISITIEGATAAAGALPRTGSDSSLPLAKIAIVLIVAGGLLVAVARDRSKKSVTV
jgi:hypothetical protein